MWKLQQKSFQWTDSASHQMAEKISEAELIPAQDEESSRSAVDCKKTIRLHRVDGRLSDDQQEEVALKTFVHLFEKAQTAEELLSAYLFAIQDRVTRSEFSTKEAQKIMYKIKMSETHQLVSCEVSQNESGYYLEFGDDDSNMIAQPLEFSDLKLERSDMKSLSIHMANLCCYRALSSCRQDHLDQYEEVLELSEGRAYKPLVPKLFLVDDLCMLLEDLGVFDILWDKDFKPATFEDAA